MSQKTNSSPDDRLRKAGIRHFDVLIHDQPREWLIKNFSQGAAQYPVNVARLMRNIIWQTRERIVNGQKPPLNEVICTLVYYRDGRATDWTLKQAQFWVLGVKKGPIINFPEGLKNS